MAHYTDDKKPTGLDLTGAAAAADLVIIQKDGETYVRAISIVNFFAAYGGIIRRSGIVAVSAAGTDVLFSTPLPGGTSYTIMRHVYNAAGAQLGYSITNRDENGFRVTPVRDGFIEYQVIEDL